MLHFILLFISLLSESNIQSQHFILVGAPGSGKGTFSQYIVEKYKYMHICPGDIYRTEILHQTKLGKEIEAIVNSGNYVDEKITNQLIENKIVNALEQNVYFILDGYPRTESTMLFLDSVLRKYNIKNKTSCIFFTASDECLIERIIHREICTKCFTVYNTKTIFSESITHCMKCGTELSKRPADTPEIAEKRIQYFHNKIEPIIKLIAETKYTIMYIDNQTDINALRTIYDQIVQEQHV
jgi:adenylate kinase